MPYTDNPYYAKALRFIEETDLAALPAGKHVIDGDHLWVNIVDSAMKTPQQARYEVHDRYIDIQVPLSKAETFGVIGATIAENFGLTLPEHLVGTSLLKSLVS